MNRTASVPLLLLTACAVESDPMPWLSSAQRACLEQVRSGVRLKDGQQVQLFVSRQGAFSGAVTDNGFIRAHLDSARYQACVAGSGSRQATAGLTEVSPGVFLNAADKALWDTLTAAQRQRALTFSANGGTLQGSLGDA